MLKGRFSILQKGFLLIGVPIAFQLVFVALFLREQNDAANSEKWALHTKDVMAKAESTFRLTLEEFSDTRSAVLVGKEATMAEVSRPADVLNEIDELYALIADNAEQIAHVKAYRATATLVMAWVNEVNDLVAGKQVAEARKKVSDAAVAEDVKHMRSELTAILDIEQQLDDARMKQVADVRWRIRLLLGLMAVIALVLAAALLMAFSGGIARRMSALMNKARALGERKPLGSPIGGQDEIAEVDHAFHETADRLEELHRTERGLRDDAERRATELARVNQDLKAKTLENETFVYSVSHDLRSPLVNLQGFSQELTEASDELRRISQRMTEAPGESRQRLLDVLDNEVAESVKFIQTAVTRASAIIDALLRLSRAGRIEYNWAVVPMREIVHRIVAAMQSTIRRRGAVVIAADDFPDAYGDATAIEQILGNLIGNAVNYIDPARPGHVEIGAIPGEPQPSTERPDLLLRTFFVRDNGVGIPPAYLPKIFVAFQRLHGQLAPGEGIGLALVQRMVERHGGRVWAESQEAKGTTFFVSLPVPPKPASPMIETERPKEIVTEIRS